MNKKNINIITKGGSLCFFGEWFGRPYDNMHRIHTVSYDGEILYITFDQNEELIIYDPEGIISTEKELKIQKAVKVKWMYIPYGSFSEKKCISYLWCDEYVQKTDTYGNVQKIRTDAGTAVLLTCY